MAVRTVLYFDGGCIPNPGKMRIAYVIDNESYTLKLSRGTNNIAEYYALIIGLKACLQHGYNDIDVRGDSKLVINQMNDAWRVKDKTLMSLNVLAKYLCQNINTTFTWVLREQNLAGKLLETV